VLLTLAFFVVFSAFLAVRAKYRGPLWRVYVFKPLTTGLILFAACMADPSFATAYQRFILLGLLFSLAGDVFLMLPGDRFIQGLVSFLIAHVFYIAGFTSGTGFGHAGWIIAAVILAGAAMAALLLPFTGKMRLPVLVYMMVILVMAQQSWDRFYASRGTNSLFAAIGATLFVFSDFLLAWNRFRRPFNSAEAVKLTAYFAAQLLIALSVQS
jgi:uncharacterized membrane protein YhhN